MFLELEAPINIVGDIHVSNVKMSGSGMSCCFCMTQNDCHGSPSITDFEKRPHCLIRMTNPPFGGQEMGTFCCQCMRDLSVL